MLGRFVSGEQVNDIVAQARRAATPWLELDDQELRAAYNTRPFLVRHRLAEHPLFTFDALAALCRRLPAKQVPYRFGVVPDDADFDSSLQRFRGELTLEDALSHLEARQAYVAVYNAETDPEYRPVIEGLLGELAGHTEPIEPASTGTRRISSSPRATP